MESFWASKTFVLSKIIFLKNIFVFLHKLCKLRLICIDTECLQSDFFSWPTQGIFVPSKIAVLKIAGAHCFLALINSTKIQYNTWIPGCMHYLLLCRENLGQAFRLSRTTFVKKACTKFEYVSKPIYWNTFCESSIILLSKIYHWKLNICTTLHYFEW